MRTRQGLPVVEADTLKALPTLLRFDAMAMQRLALMGAENPLLAKAIVEVRQKGDERHAEGMLCMYELLRIQGGD